MDYSALPPEVPEVTVLLLGDAEVGKSTFLS
jgi:GTPase SAR1 family protein